jgi:hypothetical protein
VFTEDTDIVGNSALRLFVEAQDTTDVDLFAGVEKLDATATRSISSVPPAATPTDPSPAAG